MKEKRNYDELRHNLHQFRPGRDVSGCSIPFGVFQRGLEAAVDGCAVEEGQDLFGCHVFCLSADVGFPFARRGNGVKILRLLRLRTHKQFP